MEELIDIEGLTQVGVWPLAIGWWLVILLALIVTVIATAIFIKNRRYKASWQYKSFSRLQKMQQQLDHADPKLVLQNFSLELRKIAMLSTQREACAGLIGKRWLEWLHEHDPQDFNWQENGTILLTAQYTPKINDVQNQLLKLIAAAKNWVRKC